MVFKRHFQKITILLGILVAIIIGVSFSGWATDSKDTAQAPFSIQLPQSDTPLQIEGKAKKLIQHFIKKI